MMKFDSEKIRESKEKELKQAFDIARKYLNDTSDENRMELEEFAEKHGIEIEFEKYRVFLRNAYFSAIAFSDDFWEHIFDSFSE